LLELPPQDAAAVAATTMRNLRMLKTPDDSS